MVRTSTASRKLSIFPAVVKPCLMEFPVFVRLATSIVLSIVLLVGPTSEHKTVRRHGNPKQIDREKEKDK